MKGQIFVINQQKQTGAIAAEDGQHVLFALGEWTEAKPPERGMQVEFEVTADGHAGAVRLAAASQTPAMSAQAVATAPPHPPAPPASPAPPPSTPPSAATSPQSPVLRHSGLGIAAFVISLGVGFFALIVLIAAGLAYNEGEEEAAEIIGAAFIVVRRWELSACARPGAKSCLRFWVPSFHHWRCCLRSSQSLPGRWMMRIRTLVMPKKRPRLQRLHPHPLWILLPLTGR